jgi:hypothetical protein
VAGRAGAQLLQPHRTIRPRIADNDQHVRFDANLDGLAGVVAPVIDRIDDGFLDGVVGEILDPGRFGPAMMLDDRFGNQVALDVIQRIASHAGDRPLEYLFREFVAARPFLGKPDDVDLHGREKAPWLRIEHHQADIERKRCFLRPADDAHLPAQFDQVKDWVPAWPDRCPPAANSPASVRGRGFRPSPAG